MTDDNIHIIAIFETILIDSTIWVIFLTYVATASQIYFVFRLASPAYAFWLLPHYPVPNLDPRILFEKVVVTILCRFLSQAIYTKPTNVLWGFQPVSHEAGVKYTMFFHWATEMHSKQFPLCYKSQIMFRRSEYINISVLPFQILVLATRNFCSATILISVHTGVWYTPGVVV